MSKKTSNDGSLQTTKQMLDELDVLMDRMLSVPVSDLEDASPVPEAPGTSPVLSENLALLESPPAPPKQTPESAAPSTSFRRRHFAPRPAASMTPTHATPPFLEPEPFTNDVAPPSVLAGLDAVLAEIPEPSSVPVSQWYYQSLVWLNLGFDGFAMWVPGAGVWLRSQGGRMMLGVSGVALMLAAFGWLLKDWLGWN